MVTMKEVAERLGLSRAAVSHVLNGRADRMRIKPETQRKILAAAKELGFHRNEAARTMVTGQTRIVCMLVNTLVDEFFSMSAEGVLSEANKSGMFLKMATWDSTAGFEGALRQAMELQPLGLICLGLLNAELSVLEREISLNPLPVVLMDNHSGHGAWAARVCSDDLMGFRLTLARLHELGHRSVGYLSSPLDYTCYSRNRFEQFMQAAKEIGMDFQERNLYRVHFERIAEFAAEFAADLENRPQAVVASSDGFAYYFIKGLEKCGVMVPSEVSVTGYGNNHVARYGSPQLSTVSEPYIENGKVAFAALLEMLGAPERRRSPGSFGKLTAVELIPGETVAQPRGQQKERMLCAQELNKRI